MDEQTREAERNSIEQRYCSRGIKMSLGLIATCAIGIGTIVYSAIFSPRIREKPEVVEKVERASQTLSRMEQAMDTREFPYVPSHPPHIAPLIEEAFGTDKLDKQKEAYKVMEGYVQNLKESEDFVRYNQQLERNREHADRFVNGTMYGSLGLGGLWGSLMFASEIKRRRELKKLNSQ